MDGGGESSLSESGSLGVVALNHGIAAIRARRGPCNLGRHTRWGRRSPCDRQRPCDRHRPCDHERSWGHRRRPCGRHNHQAISAGQAVRKGLAVAAWATLRSQRAMRSPQAMRLPLAMGSLAATVWPPQATGRSSQASRAPVVGHGAATGDRAVAAGHCAISTGYGGTAGLAVGAGRSSSTGGLWGRPLQLIGSP